MARTSSISVLSDQLAALLHHYQDSRQRVETAGRTLGDDLDAESDQFLQVEDQVTAMAYQEGIDLGSRPDPTSPVGNIPLRAVADGQNLFIVFGHDPDHEGEVRPEELLVIPIEPILALLKNRPTQPSPRKRAARRSRKQSRPQWPILQPS